MPFRFIFLLQLISRCALSNSPPIVFIWHPSHIGTLFGNPVFGSMSRNVESTAAVGDLSCTCNTRHPSVNHHSTMEGLKNGPRVIVIERSALLQLTW